MEARIERGVKRFASPNLERMSLGVPIGFRLGTMSYSTRRMHLLLREESGTPAGQMEPATFCDSAAPWDKDGLIEMSLLL